MNRETVSADDSDDAGLDDQGQRLENAADLDGGMPSWGEWRRSRAAWWQGHVEARRASGESRTAYCRRQGLNPGGLYHWERKLGTASEDGRRETRPAVPGRRSGLGHPDGPDRGKDPGGGDGPRLEWPFFSPAGEAPGIDGGVRFLPLGMLPMASGGGGLTVWVGPVRVELTAGFDVELLRRVVRALGVF